MANRIPLIVDTGDGNKIKELPIGDNLNLTGSGIVGAGSISATSLTINNVPYNPFSGDMQTLQENLLYLQLQMISQKEQRNFIQMKELMIEYQIFSKQVQVLHCNTMTQVI